ncbi:hypothetical protein V7S76_09880 [Aquirufa sp. ROCK2-A2]
MTSQKDNLSNQENQISKTSWQEPQLVELNIKSGADPNNFENNEYTVDIPS